MTTIAIAEFAKTTIAVLTFCILGVFGGIENAEVRESGIVAHTINPAGIAFGGFAFGNTEQRADHEYGHLVHEREIGIAFVPLAAATTIVSILSGDRPSNYFARFTERTADTHGGVSR